MSSDKQERDLLLEKLKGLLSRTPDASRIASVNSARAFKDAWAKASKRAKSSGNTSQLNEAINQLQPFYQE